MKKTLVLFTALLAISAYGCKKEDKKADGDKANPCADKNPCGDKTDKTNPCGAKTAKNPCNPCGDKAGKNPCNPCGAKNPCNPCGDKAPDPMAHYPKDMNVNMVVAKVGHTEAKPGDPVHVVFEKVTVKSSKIKDVKNLVGATAEIEIDVTQPNSGVKGRDDHLKKDFFKATATVKVSNVKKDGDNYKADAEVKLHGVTKKWPVSFKVLETKDNWVRIQGMHRFKRADFKVGDGIPGPADEVELMLQVTLKKS